MVSYSFDYRGFGNSSGWPTEEGILLDARAVHDFVRATEKCDNSQLLYFGISVGSGPASALATREPPRALVLLSPFPSMGAVLEQHYLGLLRPFLFYQFPVAENVAQLRSTALLVAHGGEDRFVPASLSDGVAARYRGDAEKLVIHSPMADHPTVFFHAAAQLSEAFSRLGFLDPAAKSPSAGVRTPPAMR